MLKSLVCVFVVLQEKCQLKKKAQPSGILPERGPWPARLCFVGRRLEKRQEKADPVTYSCVLKTVSAGSV